LVVSAPQEKEAMQVIRNTAVNLQSKLFTVGKDTKFFVKNGNFSIKGINNSYANLRINLLGKHQVINASLAIGIVEACIFMVLKSMLIV